jgi:hypothetical protein
MNSCQSRRQLRFSSWNGVTFTTTGGALFPRRNDPCPRGHGKKHKLCCGGATADWATRQAVFKKAPRTTAQQRDLRILLRKLAKAHSDPEWAEGLEGTWRREEISAMVREIFRQ